YKRKSGTSEPKHSARNDWRTRRIRNGLVWWIRRRDGRLWHGRVRHGQLRRLWRRIWWVRRWLWHRRLWNGRIRRIRRDGRTNGAAGPDVSDPTTRCINTKHIPAGRIVGWRFWRVCTDARIYVFCDALVVYGCAR
ncbi:hypothetical protein LPJ57_004815, partial [Coemansia sp. RSA 486]